MSDRAATRADGSSPRLTAAYDGPGSRRQRSRGGWVLTAESKPTRGLGAALGRSLRRLLLRLGLSSRSDRLMLLLVPLVGLSTGLAAVLILRAIDLLGHLLWRRPGDILEAAELAGGLERFLIPVMGGVLVALVIRYGKLPARGQGTGGLIEAVAIHEAVIPRRQALFTQLAGMATVASGGSLGREGPLIHTGATLASALGRRFGLGANPLRILVGCGAASGLAAAYNAPIGGAIFAMEVILGNFALEIFGPIVIASVLATFVARAYLGGEPIYDIPDYALISGWELPLYALLGVLAGVMAVVFIRAVHLGGTLFDRLPAPALLKPVLGFAAVGALGIVTPYIYGNGAATVNLALRGELALAPLLLLPLAKLAATALSSGCGGRGGLFTPSLFVGALAGGAFGLAVHQLLPSQSAEIGAWALVGMGAIAAGTTHAPLTAVLVIFELTGNYGIILPLMIACPLANLVARQIKRESIYLDALLRRGVRLPSSLEELVMEQSRASTLLRDDPHTVRETATLPEIFEIFMQTRRNHLYVLDAQDQLCGAVSLHDFKRVISSQQELSFVLAVDILYPEFPRVEESARLTEVLELFGQSDHERLPVVSSEGRYLGFVRKRDIIALYNQEVLRRPALLAKFTSPDEEPTFVELPPPYRLAQVPVPDSFIGRSLALLRLTSRYAAYVLEIKRYDSEAREQRLIPRKHTVLQRGDQLIVVAPEQEIERLREASD